MSRAPPLPQGQDERALLEYLQGFAAADWDERARGEFRAYLQSDYRRFLHTLALIPDGEGRFLEVGAAQSRVLPGGDPPASRARWI